MVWLDPVVKLSTSFFLPQNTAGRQALVGLLLSGWLPTGKQHNLIEHWRLAVSYIKLYLSLIEVLSSSSQISIQANEIIIHRLNITIHRILNTLLLTHASVSPIRAHEDGIAINYLNNSYHFPYPGPAQLPSAPPAIPQTLTSFRTTEYRRSYRPDRLEFWESPSISEDWWPSILWCAGGAPDTQGKSLRLLSFPTFSGEKSQVIWWVKVWYSLFRFCMICCCFFFFWRFWSSAIYTAKKQMLSCPWATPDRQQQGSLLTNDSTVTAINHELRVL